MRGILNRLFWVTWALWTAMWVWFAHLDNPVPDGPVTIAILGPIVLRAMVWYILRGWPLSR